MFFNNIIERIDATNFYLLSMSISIVVIELYIGRLL